MRSIKIQIKWFASIAIICEICKGQSQVFMQSEQQRVQSDELYPKKLAQL